MTEEERSKALGEVAEGILKGVGQTIPLRFLPPVEDVKAALIRAIEVENGPDRT